MCEINSNYLKLPGSYLFAGIKRRVDAYRAAHPDAKIISLGIGDVTRPLVPAVIEAMHAAVDEMADAATFRGYGPEQGYDFLIDAIIRGEYTARGIGIDRDEVFVSDGSKCDVGNIQEIFSADARVAIGDPVYPVYLDSNVMAGRTGEFGPDGRFAGITYLAGTEENGFSPEPPKERVDLVYLCSPNNPTGTVLDRAALTRWVEYAREKEAVILFDSAYSAYIREPGLPGSIYEIPGAKESVQNSGARMLHILEQSGICVTGFGDNQMLRAVTGGIPTVHFGYKTSGIKGAELLLEQIEEKNPVPVHMKLGFQIVNRFE